MTFWYATTILSGLGLFSSNPRIGGWSVWILGFSLLQLAVSWGLA